MFDEEEQVIVVIAAADDEEEDERENDNRERGSLLEFLLGDEMSGSEGGDGAETSVVVDQSDNPNKECW